DLYTRSPASTAARRSSDLFKQLHQLPVPLLLGNVWSAHSARIAEKAGYEALGTSSHAIAHMLGYEDGEEISFEELFFIVRNIRRSEEHTSELQSREHLVCR